jgi:hypothetical protein
MPAYFLTAGMPSESRTAFGSRNGSGVLDGENDSVHMIRAPQRGRAKKSRPEPATALQWQFQR